MRIADIRTERFSLPLRSAFETSAGTIARRDLALVRVATEDGTVGTGEVTPLPQRDGITIAQAVEALADRRVTALAGVAVDETAAAASTLAEFLPACAYAGLEAALFDLESRLLGLPLAALLAPEHEPGILVNAVIAAGSPDAIEKAAADVLAGGFTTVKLKVGFPDDAWRVSALRDAVGYAVRIRLDANGAWPVAEAIERIGELAQHGIELVEQPVPPDDLPGMQRVRDAVTVPIVADEGVRTLDDLRRHIEADACDGVAIKLAPVGGLTAARHIADLAAKAGKFTIVTSALDGPVGLATSVHFATTVADNDLAHGLGTAELFAPSTAPQWLLPADGRVSLPALVGHGA